uniref:Uncharacterized protein n=1 Tax=Arundo donax TaxID=35708 RepID=A0A0A9C707_ARUDO
MHSRQIQVENWDILQANVKIYQKRKNICQRPGRENTVTGIRVFHLFMNYTCEHGICGLHIHGSNKRPVEKASNSGIQYYPSLSPIIAAAWS